MSAPSKVRWVRSSTLALLALCASIAAVAQSEFSWQVSGSLHSSETGSEGEADRAAIVATRFFAPVSAEGPLALTPFLSRSSYVNVEVNDNEQRQTISIGTIGGALPLVLEPVREGDGYSLAGRKIWRESGWFVGGSYGSSDSDLGGSSISATQSDLDEYGLVVGKYLATATALELNVRSAEATTDFSPSPLCGVLLACIASTTLTTDAASLDVLHVGRIGSLSYSVTGGVLAVEADLTFRTYEPPTPPTSRLPPFTFAGGVVAAVTPVGATSILDDGLLPFERRYAYSAGGELFPTPRIGVRLGYVRWDGDPLLDDGYDVGASWFLRESVAVRFAYAHTDTDVPFLEDALESDSFTLTVLGRF